MRADDGGAILTAEQRQAADAGHKALMPIAGRPFLDYVLSAAADAGIDRIGLVVAPDHDSWRDYYRSVRPPSRVAIDFIVQAQALGTADAVRSAEAWTGGEPFLALNADNLYPAGVLRALAALPEPGLAAFDAAELVASGNIDAARVAAFALVEQDAAGYLTAIVEKPAADDAA